MHWTLIIVGLSLLAICSLLTWLLTHQNAASYGRASVPGKLLPLLRKAARLPSDRQEAAALADFALQFMEHIHHLRQALRHLPSLPEAADGEPRLLALAQEAADAEQFTTEALTEALSTWEHPATPAEVLAFPACIGAVQCQRLHLVLRTILTDARTCQQAAKPAGRLLRAKHPYALLDKAALNSLGLAALAHALRQREQPEMLVLLDRWLEVHGLTTEDLAQQDAQRQLQLAEELRRAAACFSTLETLPWVERCEDADLLHALLTKDPSGIYPDMTADARLQLRLQAEQLARRVHIEAAEVIRHALLLCEDAEPHSLEQYVGYWLQDAEGLRALHKSLGTRKGRLYARFAQQRGKLRYLLLLALGLLFGFVFLHSGEPVFMLPFFALVVGDAFRLISRQISDPPLPRIAPTQLPGHLRTLVVLPAVLHDPHEAIRMVRMLKAASHTCPQDGVEYLLLGDFAPNMTAVGSTDSAIMGAAASAVSALQDELPIHYLHRGRTWDGDQHTYCAHGGRSGAVIELCRLIVQGEYADTVACATLEPSTLERKYDYVLLLDPQRPPLPGMLLDLLQVMCHPLCSRYPTGRGWRGFAVLSPARQPLFEGFGLIRPDAFLEAADGAVPLTAEADILSGELAGHAAIGEHPRQENVPLNWDAQYADARLGWSLLPWQLPWVRTPSGIIANPLTRGSKFRLREALRATLIPTGQFVLLLWAILTQSWPLLLLALIVPELRHAAPRMSSILRSLCRLALLPMRALLPLLPLWFFLPANRRKSPAFPTLEVWSQALAATVFAALGLLLPAFAFPALLLSAAFACFPLAHRVIDGPIREEEGLSADHLAMLEDAASATWQFFRSNVNASTGYLPPCMIQFAPEHDVEPVTSPEAIGGYLLACVCAKEMGLLSAADATERISSVLSALQELPMPFGVPCRRYLLPSLTVADAQVDAAAVGFYAAALMALAQALRTWLPELSPAYIDLSASVEELLSAMDLTALYDPDTNQFWAGLDADGQPTGTLRYFADDALLLIFAAIARKQVPAACLQQLRHTCVKLGRQELQLSDHGTVSEHLLAGLFLPLVETHAVAFVRAMQQGGVDGLWAQDTCCIWQFDHQLRYQQIRHGLQGAAAIPTDAEPVFAPYAVALALPVLPRAASEALTRFAAVGAKGPEGFCDAVDRTRGTALVGLHDSFHQGLILCAVAHLLADAPLRRYFCALPEVEACLPLLHQSTPSVVLPVPPAKRRAAAPAEVPAHLVDPLQQPVPMHLLGTAEFRLLADARGASRLFDHDIPLNQSLHFYLADEGRVYPLGDPQLPGEIHFFPGEARIEQTCGSLRSELVVCADTLRRRALHIVTITNLSTRDRTIEVTSLLEPDLHAPPGTVEAARPGASCLTLHARGAGLTLRHTLDTAAPPLRTTVCTSAAAFVGRRGDLHHPALLDRPASDHLEPCDRPCSSFRTRLFLGGRGQVSLWYTTSLLDNTPLQLNELPGIRQLCAMQHAAIQTSAALSLQQCRTAEQLLPFLARAQWQMSLLVDDAASAPFQELLSILGWLLMHGQCAQLRIHCPPDIRQSLADLLPGHLGEDQVSFADPGELPALLCLRGDLPLTEQLDHLCARVTLPNADAKPPIPALLPEQKLLHAGEYGGFDPDTLDYVLQLEPGQLPPQPWTNPHVTRHFREETDETGLQFPFYEQVWIRMEDSTLLSPWSPELPRAIRMRPGETDWEAWSDQLDLRLRAACLPGHRCGLRSLHIHNATDNPLTLRITVSAKLGKSPVTYDPGLVMTDALEKQLQAFLAGDGWHAQQTADSPVPPADDLATLTCEMHLLPGRSAKAVWLAGFARHGEDVARAAAQVRSTAVSDLLREAHLPFARALSTLTISTPEATLDLLMNRILPMQALSAKGIEGVPALKYIAPHEARRALLKQARQPMSRDEWAHFILLLADYYALTQDEALLSVYLPAHGDTLINACRTALLSAPLDHRKLPQGDDPARRCFLYALAAQALNTLRGHADALEFSRTLLNAADTHLWQDGFYGTPLRLDAQSLACAAYPANPRTRQAVVTCWSVLYDRPHGLVRLHEAADLPPLPGSPQNGGMITLEAVRFMRALLKNARHDEAFELLMALNPLHHTDTPERQEIFQRAPYQLHGGMHAAPMIPGRATPDGNEAAALLYAAVLEDLLGLRRIGSTIRLSPHVPADWEDFTITLQEGASTWHISAEKRTKALTLDGEVLSGSEITIADDGKIHHVHFPLA